MSPTEKDAMAFYRHQRDEARRRIEQAQRRAAQSWLSSMASVSAAACLHPSAKVAASGMANAMRYSMASAVAGLGIDKALEFLNATEPKNER